MLSLWAGGSDVEDLGLRASRGRQSPGGEEELVVVVVAMAEVRVTGEAGPEGGRSDKEGGVSAEVGVTPGGLTGGTPAACCMRQ